MGVEPTPYKNTQHRDILKYHFNEPRLNYNCVPYKKSAEGGITCHNVPLTLSLYVPYVHSQVTRLSVSERVQNLKKNENAFSYYKKIAAWGQVSS